MKIFLCETRDPIRSYQDSAVFKLKFYANLNNNDDDDDDDDYKLNV